MDSLLNTFTEGRDPPDSILDGLRDLLDGLQSFLNCFFTLLFLVVIILVVSCQVVFFCGGLIRRSC